MKIALIGDVHANLPALEAVLEHARLQGTQAVWNIGDFVGYNAFPDEVVSLMRSKTNTVSILGNYDQKVLQVPEKQEKWRKSKDPRKVQAFVWAYQHLSEINRDYLRMLPEQREIVQDGWRVLLAHGSPASINEHLFPDTPVERMRELAAMTTAKIVIVGHSHMAFTRQVEDTGFINTGSVGRPDDGDPRAAYAVLTLSPDRWDCDHFRIPYDVERAAKAILAQGLPSKFAEMIRRGRSLDAVENGSEPND